MFKFVKILQDIRLSVYVVLVAFQVQMFLDIGGEILGGKANETTFYKLVSFVWSIFSLVCLRAVYAMWLALEKSTDDIKALKQKGHMQGAGEPMQIFGAEVPPEGEIVRPLTSDEIRKIQLVEHYIRQKQENKPGN